MKINIGKVFAERAFLSPNLAAWVGQGYRYTFHEADLRINRFAGFLAARGVAKGDRIAVLCKNNEHAMTAMLAAAKIGVITVLLNWRLQVRELAYILSGCGAGLLLYDTGFRPSAEALKQTDEKLVLVRVGGEGPGIAFESAPAEFHPQQPDITDGDDDPALLMYTSGNTGNPKTARRMICPFPIAIIPIISIRF